MKQPDLRWIVASDGTRLGALVERWGASAQAALDDGRVFVDGKRERNREHVLRAGSKVEVYAARAASADIELLAEQAGLVLVSKPALLATEPDRSGVRDTVLSRAAAALGCKPEALHALSRLDVGVSGIVLLARAGAGKVVKHERQYVAIAEHAPVPSTGAWCSPIVRSVRGVQDADTRYALVRELAERVYRSARERRNVAPALLALEPLTGRLHQLRVHAARAGCPILGDRAHSGLRRFPRLDGSVCELSQIALHACAVRVLTSAGEEISANAPPGLELREVWRALGGDDTDWERAPHLV